MAAVRTVLGFEVEMVHLTVSCRFCAFLLSSSSFFASRASLTFSTSILSSSTFSAGLSFVDLVVAPLGLKEHGLGGARLYLPLVLA